MRKFEDLIDSDTILSRMTDYELDRGPEGRVFIRVHEILTGSKKGSFIAYPTWVVGRTKNQYMVMAETHDDALDECLLRIKGVPLDDLKEEP